MHLSIWCPTTPPPGAKLGEIWGFDPNFAPVCGGFDQCFCRDEMESAHCIQVDSSEETTVLVCLETQNGSRNREVTFKGHKDELVRGINHVFSDIFCGKTVPLIIQVRDILGSNAVQLTVYLVKQVRDETWGQGMFVDLVKQHIPNRAVIKAIQVVHKPEVGLGVGLCLYFIYTCNNKGLRFIFSLYILCHAVWLAGPPLYQELINQGACSSV